MRYYLCWELLKQARNLAFAVDDSDGGHFCKAVTVLFVHPQALAILKLHCRYLVLCMRDVLMYQEV